MPEWLVKATLKGLDRKQQQNAGAALSSSPSVVSSGSSSARRQHEDMHAWRLRLRLLGLDNL